MMFTKTKLIHPQMPTRLQINAIKLGHFEITKVPGRANLCGSTALESWAIVRMVMRFAKIGAQVIQDIKKQKLRRNWLIVLQFHQQHVRSLKNRILPVARVACKSAIVRSVLVGKVDLKSTNPKTVVNQLIYWRSYSSSIAS